MSIFTVADLHLSLSPDIHKPMDIYGPRWCDHTARLETGWRAAVKEGDTVVVAGDISWALKLDDARYDLDWIDALPGRKVFLKGNHDLWWSGITKLNQMYDSITFLQNDCFEAEGFVICGSRGWITPDNDDFTADDEKIYKRELLRLKSSLESGKVLMQKGGYREMLGIMHFPPVSKPSAFSGFQQLFEDYGIKRVFYGHIHGEDGFHNTIMGIHHGIEYQLISLDYLNCTLLEVTNDQ